MSATAPFLRFFACASHSSSRRPSSPHAVATDVSWNDVLNFSVRRRDLRVEDSGVAGLEAYMEKVNLCNRNWDKQSEFVPFVVEGMVVGYVHNR
ncbi:hypothetical protein M569_12987 [Genlisea aurea]|uniref:Uncharacterized protein n=1 Tax=Genlisea aurea TaxID=192259 RepID=S8CBP2_9LAMI|nr:hypothetical protein M569_12987 [Genlisea aurea]